jgi:O-antigen/teichoic acid export membrane protein
MNVRKEIFLSTFYKIINMLLTFLTIGLLVKETHQSLYGEWAAILSLIGFLQVSDLGLNLAIKNKIAKLQNIELLIPEVSRVFKIYWMIFFLGVVFLLFLLALSQYFQEISIFKENTKTAFFLYAAVLLTLPFNLSSAILQGLNKNSTAMAFPVIHSLIYLLAVLFFIAINQINILCLCIIYGLAGLISVLLQFYYCNRIIDIKKLMFFSENKISTSNHNTIEIGVKFLFLQLSNIAIFSLGTYLVYKNLGADFATKYEILFKFFQVPLMLFNMAVAVYWTKMASIHGNQPYKVKKEYLELLKISIGFLIFFSLFYGLFLSKIIYIYTSAKIMITQADVVAFLVLLTVQLLTYVGGVVVNVSEELNAQIIFSALSVVIILCGSDFIFKQFTGWGISIFPVFLSIATLPVLLHVHFFVHKKTY